MDTNKTVNTFEMDFLETVSQLYETEQKLSSIGLSGSTEYKNLLAAVVRHGHETLNDILFHEENDT